MILVTGATGRVGSEVVRTLRRLNLSARALVRKGSEYFWLNDTGCQYFFGDLRDARSLARAARGMRYLIVATNVPLESRDNNHAIVTVEGLKSLLGVAREVERVVLVSCLGAGKGLRAVAFQARRSAEEVVQASGLPYTVLRAGPHEGVFLDLAMAGRSGPVLQPGPGTNLVSPLAAVDIARMAVASLDLAAVKDQVLEVGGEPTQSGALLREACAAVGVSAAPTTLPGPLVALGARLGRPVRRYANRLAEQSVWFREELVADPAATAARFNLKLSPFGSALQTQGDRLVRMEDPEQKEAMIVHRQFYATIYEPGTARLEDLPDGPPPRAD